MLTKLIVKNFALIEDLSVELKDGLVVFTGETGSGKSIFINALNFLIGERADKTFVRYNSEYAKVEGVFESLDEKTLKICEELGIETNGELILSRKLTLDGKSDIRANGNVLNLSMLKRLTANLVDIYGQHQHQCLLDEASHINFVDAYDFPLELGKLKEINDKIAELNKKLSVFGGDESFLARQKDILEFELEELHSANLNLKEEEELLEKKKKFSNVQKVSESISFVQNLFSEQESFSVEGAFSSAIKTLKNISFLDNNIENEANRLESLKIDFDDIKESLNSILESYDFSQEEFEEMETRLEVLNKIKRKYGGTIENAINYMKDAEEKLFVLENSEQEIEKLSDEKQKLFEEGQKLCEIITSKRKNNALKIEEEVIKELKNLGMANSKLVVEFKKLDNFSNSGWDDVKFLFSANAGEPLKPLSKVISGGEMSRFMLAFKVVFGEKNSISTMVFDEIDNGIGGETGFAVGLKLIELSKHSQVFVVTHLASIGAMADQHFKIQKELLKDRTITKLTCLNEEEQVDEIARLAGGFKGALASEYAKQLKLRANQVKF